jgi:hypothetical protein
MEAEFQAKKKRIRRVKNKTIQGRGETRRWIVIG